MLKTVFKSSIFAISLFCISVGAEQITIPLSSESESGNTKYCFYENSNYSFTDEVPVSRNCPFTQTFDTSEDEDE